MSEIAILIPVLGRAERIVPLIENIRSTCEHKILFLCSPRDDAAWPCLESDEHAVVVDWKPGPGDFARKTNLGLKLTEEPFVFCGATDLTFTAGWDNEALEVAEQTGAGVIGTWDGANPMTMKGEHATHPLVRRSYAEDPGCVVDGQGSIYCELYDHQAVDNELVETARARGQWAFAAKSRVIHHHPVFDRSTKMDATYRKAMAHGRQDMRLLSQRRRLWAMERKLTRS